MRILVLGSGGREHALAWKLSQSHLVSDLFVGPGNPGTSSLTLTNGKQVQNVALLTNDFQSVENVLLQYAIDMLVVGPEEPLVMGIADYCKNRKGLENILVIGPDRRGASLEGSKDHAKAFMTACRIPTALYRTFSCGQYAEACLYLDSLEPPYVLKADGLAAGKGVLVEPNLDKARAGLKEMMEGKFGAAGNKVVVEQFLRGTEVSVFILTDGIHYKVLPEAKDYKRIGEHDQGPNTGGMGAVSPVPFADADFMKKVEERIIKPTLEGLAIRGCDYQGFLFFGLINCNGDPYVIEYNVRMGDPETESVMMRLEGDLAAACYSLKTKTLDKVALSAASCHSVTVVAASGGYPGQVKKGFPVRGLDHVKEATVFHMGTSAMPHVVTAGGRVLAVSATGSTLLTAREKAYRQLSSISFSDMVYRKDIGEDLMDFKKQ
ncbi:MAG: phosphoribosylamine--glycine ligase [Bacteroidales bacterium]|jgi:phosphoribosylamine--glycine ligase|nr:phosphoribosylamine--glycine ligase [Bacteroidales bacterium]NLH24528.1 phosphoribosylamine--glycine ligase [Bacteroidales bacterium]HPJ82749.1 phosphoribosylamine--glycine ligase [Bacteroidales bacterium]